jgi:hypothetical protein
MPSPVVSLNPWSGEAAEIGQRTIHNFLLRSSLERATSKEKQRTTRLSLILAI